MDLFESAGEERILRSAPLPARLRPQTIAEVVGQPALVAPGAAFRTIVESGRPVSMLLWGPPGTGKTTLARLVASHSEATFVTLSATNAGVKDVREVLAGARSRLAMEERRTVLFIDEIHRFSKSQQDALLPGVEDGTIVLVGATTENPFFEVNSPLMSRMTLFRTEKLGPDAVEEMIERALTDERGLADTGLMIDDEAKEALVDRSGGDARHTLNALEVAATLAQGREAATINVDDVSDALQRRIVRYDKAGDQHYDVVSAFIKSLRGSDPDAALYWLHLMIAGGEDPEFIVRRMVILASEDIGLADPNALLQANAAAQALAMVGLPEAGFAMSQATVYLAVAPKSNSVTRAIGAAQALVDSTSGTVPEHLRDSHYPGAATLGHGTTYRYAHEHPHHIVSQEYFADGVSPSVLYEPGTEGREPAMSERLEWIDGVLGRQGRIRTHRQSEGVED